MWSFGISLRNMVRPSYVGLVGLLTLVQVLAAGCEADSGPQRQRVEPTEILFIGEAKNVATWQVIEATSRVFSEEHPSVTVESIAPMSASPMEQQTMLRDALKRDFRAVCIFPTQPDALREAVTEVSSSGIPVVVIGRDINNCRRDAYCGPSETQLGELTAAACGKVLENRGNTVMLLQASKLDERQAARYRGFKEQLPIAGYFKIVREVDGAGDPGKSVHLVKIEARKYPRVGCWVLLDDWPLRALDPDERLFGLGVTMVLCNGDPANWHRMEDGQILAMVSYDVQKAVREGLSTALTLTMRNNKRKTLDFHIDGEVILTSDFPEYQARWELWKRGLPSPPK